MESATATETASSSSSPPTVEPVKSSVDPPPLEEDSSDENDVKMSPEEANINHQPPRNFQYLMPNHPHYFVAAPPPTMAAPPPRGEYGSEESRRMVANILVGDFSRDTPSLPTTSNSMAVVPETCRSVEPDGAPSSCDVASMPRSIANNDNHTRTNKRNLPDVVGKKLNINPGQPAAAGSRSTATPMYAPYVVNAAPSGPGGSQQVLVPSYIFGQPASFPSGSMTHPSAFFVGGSTDRRMPMQQYYSYPSGPSVSPAVTPHLSLQSTGTSTNNNNNKNNTSSDGSGDDAAPPSTNSSAAPGGPVPMAGPPMPQAHFLAQYGQRMQPVSVLPPNGQPVAFVPTMAFQPVPTTAIPVPGGNFPIAIPAPAQAPPGTAPSNNSSKNNSAKVANNPSKKNTTTTMPPPTMQPGMPVYSYPPPGAFFFPGMPPMMPAQMAGMKKMQPTPAGMSMDPRCFPNGVKVMQQMKPCNNPNNSNMNNSNNNNMNNTMNHNSLATAELRKRKLMSDDQGRGYTDLDVLLGRGGRAAHHPGNKRYLALKDEMQKVYRGAKKTVKTTISQDLVQAVKDWGGRFLRLTDDGKWVPVPNSEAQRKASQALREVNTPEERAKKRLRYANKQKSEDNKKEEKERENDKETEAEAEMEPQNESVATETN